MNNGRRELEIPEFLQKKQSLEIEPQREQFYDYNLKDTKEEQTMQDSRELKFTKFERELPNKDNIIDFQEYKRLKRVKANEEISTKKCYDVKISKNKLKIILAVLLATAALTVVGVKGYNNIVEERAFIETTIENDDYLKNIRIYNSDATPEPELRIVSQDKDFQEFVSNEVVAEYINNMNNLTEEQKEDIANHFGVEISEKTNGRSH